LWIIWHDRPRSFIADRYKFHTIAGLTIKTKIFPGLEILQAELAVALVGESPLEEHDLSAMPRKPQNDS
jgi:hypothetical protein